MKKQNKNNFKKIFGALKRGNEKFPQIEKIEEKTTKSWKKSTKSLNKQTKKEIKQVKETIQD